MAHRILPSDAMTLVTLRKRMLEGRTLTLHLYWLADVLVSGKESFYLGYIIYLNSCFSVESKHHTDNFNSVLKVGSYHSSQHP